MTASVGTKAFRGIALLSGKAMITKVVGAVGQLVLASVLVPEEFGLVGLAFSVAAFLAVTERLGVRELMIHQQGRIGRWSNAAVWFSGTIGLASGAVLLAAAPIAAHLWGKPALLPLIAVLAGALPFQTLVPALESHLEVDLRFKEVTLVGLAVEAGRMGLAIALALLGFGAMSFILPRLVFAAAQVAALAMLVRPPLRLSPQLHRWPLFVSASRWFVLATLCEIGILQGDYIVLGLAATTAEVGFYFFAFNQSSQVVQLFVTNIVRVLMPGLSTMRDHPRAQVVAFVRALGLLGPVVVPLGFLQAAAAGPFLRLVFADRWVESIAPLQVLSVAAVLVAMGGPATSLIIAQKRLRTYFVFRVAGLAGFLAIITSGALIGRAYGHVTLGVAIGVLVFRLANNPLTCWIACRPAGRPYWSLAWLFVKPAIGAGAAVALGALAMRAVPPDAFTNPRVLEGARLVVLGAVSGPLYLLWFLGAHRRQANDLRHTLLPALLHREPAPEGAHEHV